MALGPVSSTMASAGLAVTLLPLRQDNYAYLLQDQLTGRTAVVDPSDAAPVILALDERGLKLDLVLNTHHHPDHVGGNSGLKARYGCKVVGPEYDRHRLATLDLGVKAGDSTSVGKSVAKVLYIPGHTMGHIAFWFAAAEALFCGDTLFSLGCGRLFEGSPELMFSSLSQLAALPGSTRVYCGHEYTAANGRFALQVEPENQELQTRVAAVLKLRAQGLPTVPSTIESERRCNPFLRAESAAIFAERRRLKDLSG